MRRTALDLNFRKTLDLSKDNGLKVFLFEDSTETLLWRYVKPNKETHK